MGAWTSATLVAALLAFFAGRHRRRDTRTPLDAAIAGASATAHTTTFPEGGESER